MLYPCEFKLNFQKFNIWAWKRFWREALPKRSWENALNRRIQKMHRKPVISQHTKSNSFVPAFRWEHHRGKYINQFGEMSSQCRLKWWFSNRKTFESIQKNDFVKVPRISFYFSSIYIFSLYNLLKFHVFIDYIPYPWNSKVELIPLSMFDFSKRTTSCFAMPP